MSSTASRSDSYTSSSSMRSSVSRLERNSMLELPDLVGTVSTVYGTTEGSPSTGACGRPPSARSPSNALAIVRVEISYQSKRGAVNEPSGEFTALKRWGRIVSVVHTPLTEIPQTGNRYNQTDERTGTVRRRAPRSALRGRKSERARSPLGFTRRIATRRYDRRSGDGSGTLVGGSVCDRLGIEFVEIGDGSVTTRLDVNFAGVLHGGAAFSLTDAAAGAALSSLVGEDGSIALEANVSYLSALEEGETVVATAEVSHESRKTGEMTVTLETEEGTRAASYRCRGYKF